MDVDDENLIDPRCRGINVTEGSVVSMSNAPSSSGLTAVPPVVGQNQSILPAGGPSLAHGVLAPQQQQTVGAQGAARSYRSRDPTVPTNATSRPGAGGSSRYITSVPRNMTVPNLEAPGMACTDPVCSCGHVVWPTSGILTIPPCGIVCEVCGLSRGDFGRDTSNLRRHVRDHHLITSTVGGRAGRTHPARLYQGVKGAK